MTPRRLVPVAAALSVVAAAVLVVFAVDVLRWDRSLEAQDVRFLATPGRVRFEHPPSLLPFAPAEGVLGGGDDLAFREQLAGFARVRPGTVQLWTEPLQAVRGETQIQLVRLGRVDPEPARRSRASNMVGVLALDPLLAPRDPGELANLLGGAIGSFRNAVEIDPSNADAKINLELALRIPGAAQVPGEGPSGSRNTGDRAGIGRAGSGY